MLVFDWSGLVVLKHFARMRDGGIGVFVSESRTVGIADSVQKLQPRYLTLIFLVVVVVSETLPRKRTRFIERNSQLFCMSQLMPQSMCSARGMGRRK